MANDSSNPSTEKAPSRQTIKRNRRTAKSAARSSRRSAARSAEPTPPAASQSTASQAEPNSPAASSPSSIEQTHALVVSSRRKRYTDNRPVDPSPIEVSQTVRMAGMRPIGTSPNIPGSPRSDFTRSPQILNRPIAPNTSAEDEEMLGYLD